MWFKAVSLLHDGSWSRTVARERWIAPITGWQGVSKGVRKPPCRKTQLRGFLFTLPESRAGLPKLILFFNQAPFFASISGKEHTENLSTIGCFLMRKCANTSFCIRWTAFVARPSCRCSRNPFQLEREGKVSAPPPLYYCLLSPFDGAHTEQCNVVLWSMTEWSRVIHIY